MENETRTHWKKNNDSRYISGEDLKAELNGLKKEMIVTVHKFNDSGTFDQKLQKEVTKTALFLKDAAGKEVYKPAILNNTNAKFFIKEFGSEFMEDWLNRPVTIYAAPDKRHGFVVRFKSYQKPHLQADTELFARAVVGLKAQTSTMETIKSRFNVSPDVEAKLLKEVANG